MRLTDRAALNVGEGVSENLTNGSSDGVRLGSNVLVGLGIGVAVSALDVARACVVPVAHRIFSANCVAVAAGFGLLTVDGERMGALVGGDVATVLVG